MNERTEPYEAEPDAAADATRAAAGPPAGAPPPSAAYTRARAAAARLKAERDPYKRFAVGALLATLAWQLWLRGSTPEFWDMGLWSLAVMISIGLVLAPLLRERLGVDEARAAQYVVAGAGGMVFMWVVFLLPSIRSNQAFFGTLATALSVLAAWAVYPQAVRAFDADADEGGVEEHADDGTR